MTHTQLTDMVISEVKIINTETEVLRVPGGWIYITKKPGLRGTWAITSTFVPQR